MADTFQSSSSGIDSSSNSLSSDSGRRSSPGDEEEHVATTTTTTTTTATATATTTKTQSEPSDRADTSRVDDDSSAPPQAASSEKKDAGSTAADDADHTTSDAQAQGVEAFWPLSAENLLQFPRRAPILKEYFMGGEERYQVVLSFLQSLAALNDAEDKPRVQFRVLTRGVAETTNAFLNATDLKAGGKFIHSVWDTHGSGFNAADEKIEFDEDLLEECGNKLDMIQVFADEIDATRVIFAEDMKSHDCRGYTDWLKSRKETGSFVCKLLPLTYESTGLKQAELDSVLKQVKGWQEEGNITLVVFDFDCTITSQHFYKTLYWLSGPYHIDFVKWLPSEYYGDPTVRRKIQKSLAPDDDVP